MADKVEKILDIKVNYNDAIKAIVEYQDKIKSARDAEAKLKEQLKAGGISREQYNEEMVASKAYITDCNDSIRVITKTMQNQIKQEKAQENSLVSLRAQLSNLTAEYDALSEAERNGAKGTELKDNINGITDSLKGAEEETQRYYRNVGNYRDSILQAAEANIPFISELHSGMDALKGFKGYLKDVIGEFNGIISQYKSGTISANSFSGAQRTAAISSNLFSTALKVLKLALISTGIGAIVVLLGSLVAWMTKTQKGTEFLSNVMASFGAVVNVLIDRIAKFGGALAKLFAGDFSGAWNDMKESCSGIGEEIANDAKQAWALNDAMQQLEKRETMLSMKRAASRAEIEKLKLIADDTTKSLEKRTKAAQKAYDMENVLQKESIEIGKKKLANLLGQTELTQECNDLLDKMARGAITADEAISKLGLSESTVKDLKEFSQMFSEVAQKEMESYTRNKETQNKINSMKKEDAGKAIEIQKERADKEIEAIRQKEDAMLSLIKDGIEKQRQQITLTYDREIEDLKKKLAEEKNLTQRAKDSINQIIKAKEQQRSEELEKLSKDQLQKEIENRQRLITIQLEAAKEGSEQEYQLKMQQLQAQREAELSNKELTEEMKLAIQDKYNKQVDDLATQHEQEIINKQQEAMRIRFETEIAQAKGNHEEILRIKIEQKQAELDSLQQLESESLEAFNLRKIKLQNEYLSAKQELSNKEIEIETKKTEALSALAGNLSSLIDQAAGDNEEMARLAKVLAIAEIAIAQGVAIAQAVKTATSSSATWIDMLVAIGTVVASVTTVMGTAMKSVKSAKFADGGLVTGPGTGTSDSIPTQLSNGESVITAKATSMFAPILSSFNMMGGGVPISVTATNNQSIGEDMLARAVAKGMMMAPAPIVSVEEFTSVADRVKYIEESGSL